MPKGQLIGLTYVGLLAGKVPASATNGKKSILVQTGKSKLHQYQLVPIPTELMHAKVKEGGG